MVQTQVNALLGDDQTEIRSIELDLLYSESVLVCGHRSGALVVWDLPSRCAHVHKHAHDKSIETIRLSDRFLVTGSADNTIKVWRRSASRSDALRHIWTLTGHKAFVSALHLSCDTLVSSSPGDCSIRTWDLTTGCCTSSYVHPGSVAYAHLDGQRLTLGSQVRLYDERIQRQVPVLSAPQSVTLAAYGGFRDGRLKRLVTVGSRGCTIWRDVDTWVRQYHWVELCECRELGVPMHPKISVFRHLQVDGRRVICCPGSRITVWKKFSCFVRGICRLGWGEDECYHTVRNRDTHYPCKANM